MVSLLQTGRFVVVRFIARYNITELKNQYSSNRTGLHQEITELIF